MGLTLATFSGEGKNARWGNQSPDALQCADGFVRRFVIEFTMNGGTITCEYERSTPTLEKEIGECVEWYNTYLSK